MKLRPVNIIEIIVAILFVAGHFLMNARIEYMGLISALSGLILSSLYFYGGIITFKSPGISIGNRIAYGLILGFEVMALVYSFQHWPYARFFLNIGIALFIILAIVRTVALYVLHKAEVLNYNKGIAIRYILLLVCMIITLFTATFIN
jgi:hypothetical protein